jgi:lactoylglutathione lyase
MENQQNIKQTVPFLAVSNMQKSLEFYIKGLGFEIQHQWVPKDRIMWCKLTNGNGALMLQEHHQMANGIMEGKGHVGMGMSIFFICDDALRIYRQMIDNGLNASEPFVGNNMWVTSINDPDGYSINFESITDVMEGTKLSEWTE